MLALLGKRQGRGHRQQGALAEHGPELFDRARELGRSIAFEASVAGGIPIIATISQCLSANQILSLNAILNGTSNFVLTQMEEQGISYAEAVAEAQRRGYAEADPRWTSTAPTRPRSWPSWPTWPLAPACTGATFRGTGIDTLDVADMRYAKELGYRIKLLAVAELVPERPGTARFAHAGPPRHAAGRSARRLQRHSRGGRRRGPGVSSTAWGRGRCPPPRPWWPI